MGLYMPAPTPHDDMPTELDPRRRRLLFRARHRGTREADLMVGGFVARHIGALSEAELDALEAVLDHPDGTLADYLSSLERLAGLGTAVAFPLYAQAYGNLFMPSALLVFTLGWRLHQVRRSDVAAHTARPAPQPASASPEPAAA